MRKKTNAPYYDPFTDTIHNVTDTSGYDWHHEMRHKIQNRNPFIRWMNLYYNTLLLWSFPLFVILALVADDGGRSFLFTIFIVLHIIKYLFVWILEIDAVIAGLRKKL